MNKKEELTLIRDIDNDPRSQKQWNDAFELKENIHSYKDVTQYLDEDEEKEHDWSD